MRKYLLSSCVALGMALGASNVAHATTFMSDDADRFSSVNEAVSAGVWANSDGAVSISTNYAHSGSKSYKLSFPANESVAYLGFRMPSGKNRVFIRWWELRERAGDFAGAKDFDWSAEKTLRVRSATIGSVGIDYCLGWEAASGQRGTSGTDGPGDMVIFGNSAASNDANLVTARPNGISRGQWNMIEMEINLGTVGRADGAVRLWVNDVLIGQSTGVSLLPSGLATIDVIWVGGWYSGLSPNPSPANRYIDDVVIADQKIGGTAQIRPNPPGNIVAQ